jgi:hypothetical protein
VSAPPPVEWSKGPHQTPTIEQFLKLVCNKGEDSPQTLLQNLYPFMLTQKYSSVEDLLMISQSWKATEIKEIEMMMKTFSEIIHVVNI